jgi:2-keto-4-pentenoate hydratase/2-oxohepta-3-ene-1,7-dioic acid hydratase in catechol pathway
MMRIARYEIDGETVWGAVQADGGCRRLLASPFESLVLGARRDAPEKIRLLAPVPAPRVFGVGLNYVSHIAESGQAAPSIPMLFMKPSTAVIGPEEPIVYPREADNTHFEGELAVVVGRTARRVSSADALDYVLGYTCANDVSERTIQSAEMAMGCLLVGKGFDSFCPLGPVIATGLDPTDLALETRVNGEVRQSISTADLLFPVADLVSYLSQSMTLLPGDVIITGTPSGVGPLQPGDVVEIEIEGVGVLRNPVVAEQDG